MITVFVSIMVFNQNVVFRLTRWAATVAIAAVFALSLDAASQVTTTPDPHQDETQSQEIAKQLVNPVSSVRSFPFVNNFDFRLGAKENGFRYTINFQPLLPFKLNDHWNLISRTIAPFVHQTDVIGNSSQTGLGDFLQSFFFSPRKTKPFMWGAGPAMLIPTATSKFLGTGKLSIGPTFVILRQQRGWTYGALTYHVWSVTGDDARADVSSTFLQPFFAYTTKSGWTLNANSDSTKNWKTSQWSVPLNIFLTKLVRVGGQPVNVGGGARCWATAPTGGAHGCGVRVNITLGSSRLSL